MQVFVFDVKIGSVESYFFYDHWAAFTDDAGKRWTIDQALHLREE